MPTLLQHSLQASLSLYPMMVNLNLIWNLLMVKVKKKPSLCVTKMTFLCKGRRNLMSISTFFQPRS